MPDTLPVALAITAIGMTLLFLTLGLFYGLLALLTAVVRDRRAGRGAEDAPVPVVTPAPDEDASARLRAAAIAVALARAESVSASTLPDLGREDVAAAGGWWALYHGRRLAAPPSPWRGR